MTEEAPAEAPAKPARKRRKLTRMRKVAFALIALFMGLLLTEGLLQVICLVFPKVHYAISDDDPPSRIDDPVLGARPNPDAPDHDSSGWRNPERPDDTEIICLGDSQTYGVRCEADEAWPAVLEHLSGDDTYNMALGGYGPTHLAVLTPEALELDPELLIVAIYAGNDVIDAYRMVYEGEGGNLPELRSTDPATLKALRSADAALPDLAADWHELQRVIDPDGPKEPSFENELSTSFRLYGLLRSTRKAISASAEAERKKTPEAIEARWKGRLERVAQANDADVMLAYDRQSIRTVLVPRARAKLGMADPRVEEGYRLLTDSLQKIREKAGSIPVEVVFIPTKELVFAQELLEARMTLSPAYETLVRDEQAFWARLRSFLGGQNIAFVDTLDALRGCIDHGINPYPEEWDGHCNAAGNAAIAEAVAASSAVKEVD